MKLIYHQGNNFGDALNPIIFNHYIPDLLTNKADENLLGIGSIIGLKSNLKGRKIVFSSGYAANQVETYGQLPKLNEDWDIFCVRGPLTAKALQINESLAISDGAILLPKVIPPPTQNPKSYTFGFMPHHKSIEMFNEWATICKNLNIIFIDPSQNPFIVLKEILSVKVLLTEAMHGAIIADAYRIPWVPIKLYPYINEFKWFDWAKSLEIENLVFHSFSSTLHDITFLKKVFNNKTKNLIPSFVTNISVNQILSFRKKKFTKELKNILKTHHPLLSCESTLKDKQNLLIERFTDLKMKYGH
ncbi:MAG: hypothetical protein PWR04_1529 [Anaerophaga sp.]|nr:hypothetical protein [Anaerophaga sp.]